MQVSQDALQSSTENQANLSLRGHQPQLFNGQCATILALLLSNRGNWVPAYKLAALALQYSSRVASLRSAGYVTQNKTERAGGKVHGSFRLVACPGETGELNGGH
jgi:hypothetical protein